MTPRAPYGIEAQRKAERRGERREREEERERTPGDGVWCLVPPPVGLVGLQRKDPWSIIDIAGGQCAPRRM